MEENSKERQMFQLHKKGYEEISKALHELSKALNFSGINMIEGRPGEPGKDGNDAPKPQVGIDFWTEEDKEFIISEAVKRIPVPRDGEDAEPVDYEYIKDFIISKIPKPKEAEAIDYAYVISEVMKNIVIPEAKEPEPIDYTSIYDFCEKRILEIDNERQSRYRQLNSAGPTTRLGELVDLSIEGASDGMALVKRGDRYVFETVITPETQNLQAVTDLGAITDNIITLPGIQFDTTATPATNAEGLLQWNTTDGTLDLGMSGGDITQQIGQELFIKVRNASGSTISNGTPVYFNGRQGNRPKIYPAKSDAEATSIVMGLTTQDIANDADGYITTFGYVRQIKTNYSGSGIWGTTWNEGDALYVSKSNAGQLTNVEPAVPHHSCVVGYVGVVGALGIGSIFVNIRQHQRLENLSDVNGTPLATTGQFPVWNQASGYFDFDYNIDDYWKSDGSSTATGDWDIGAYNFTTTGIGTFGSTYQAILGDSSGNSAGYFTSATRSVYLAQDDFAATFSGGVGAVSLSTDAYGIYVQAGGIQVDSGDVSIAGGNLFVTYGSFLLGGLLVGESTPFDNSVSFEVLGKGGFVSPSNIYQAYFTDDNNLFAGKFTDGTHTAYLGDGTNSISSYGGIYSSTLASVGNGFAAQFNDGTNIITLCDGTNPITINSYVAYTGDLNDSTSTKIADVVGGLITAVYY